MQRAEEKKKPSRLFFVDVRVCYQTRISLVLSLRGNSTSLFSIFNSAVTCDAGRPPAFTSRREEFIYTCSKISTCPGAISSCRWVRDFTRWKRIILRFVAYAQKTHVLFYKVFKTSRTLEKNLLDFIILSTILLTQKFPYADKNNNSFWLLVLAALIVESIDLESIKNFLYKSFFFYFWIQSTGG